jgi:hypothetical protein
MNILNIDNFSEERLDAIVWHKLLYLFELPRTEEMVSGTSQINVSPFVNKSGLWHL